MAKIKSQMKTIMSIQTKNMIMLRDLLTKIDILLFKNRTVEKVLRKLPILAGFLYGGYCAYILKYGQTNHEFLLYIGFIVGIMLAFFQADGNVYEMRLYNLRKRLKEVEDYDIEVTFDTYLDYNVNVSESDDDDEEDDDED